MDAGTEFVLVGEGVLKTISKPIYHTHLFMDHLLKGSINQSKIEYTGGWMPTKQKNI